VEAPACCGMQTDRGRRGRHAADPTCRMSCQACWLQAGLHAYLLLREDTLVAPSIRWPASSCAATHQRRMLISSPAVHGQLCMGTAWRLCPCAQALTCVRGKRDCTAERVGMCTADICTGEPKTVASCALSTSNLRECPRRLKLRLRGSLRSMAGSTCAAASMSEVK